MGNLRKSIRDASQSTTQGTQTGRFAAMGRGKTGSVDMVNNPPHYQSFDRYGFKHEVVDCCEAHKLDSAEAQAVQYILRARRKRNYIEDMEKAMWWIRRAIENEKYALGMCLVLSDDEKANQQALRDHKDKPHAPTDSGR